MKNTSETKSNIKPQKGQFGYIDYSKRKSLIMSIISMSMVLIIFFTGIIIYKTNKSLFSVIAAVATLPAAKALTGYIVIFPYRTGSRSLYDKLKKKVEANKEYQAIIGSDLILSSQSKTMNISFIYIINGKIIGLCDHKKVNVKETEKYVREILEGSECVFSQVKIYDTEEKFLKHIDEIYMDLGKEYPDKRILEKLCVYSI